MTLRGSVDPDGEGARVVVAWEPHPRTFWRRVLMARMRNLQLRREVRTSMHALEACIVRAGERR